MAYLAGAPRRRPFRVGGGVRQPLFAPIALRRAPNPVLYTAQLGDVTADVVNTASGALTNPVGTVTGLLSKAVASVFGTGDVSAFQDMIVHNTAQLAAQGNSSALAELAGLSGRYGAVVVPDKASVIAGLQAMRPDQASSIAPWLTYPTSTVAGPTQRYGSQDLAWSAFQALVQASGQPVPPPNQYNGRHQPPPNVNNPTQLALAWPPTGTPGQVTSTLYGGLPGVGTTGPTVGPRPMLTDGFGGSPLLWIAVAGGAYFLLKRR